MSGLSADEVIARIIDQWQGHLCPFCAKEPRPVHIGILASYTLSCAQCHKVIEAFELQWTLDGSLAQVNHVRPTLKGRRRYIPTSSY